MGGPSGLSAVLIAVSISLVAYVALCRQRHLHRQRMADLELARQQLRVHAEALVKVVDAPGVPAVLKALLCKVSGGFDDHDQMQAFADWLCAREDLAPTSDVGGTRKMLRQLRAMAPELAAAFMCCVNSGFAGGMLRWPDTAAIWRMTASRYLGLVDRELILAQHIGAMPRPARSAAAR